MYDIINHQLEEARQAVYRLRKINSMLEESNKQKKLLEQKVTDLKEVMDQEEVDVEKLERKSLAHLFHSFLGDREEKLQKERQEALAAHLKYDQAVSDLDKISKEIESVKSEQNQLKGSEAKYQDLFYKKKETLLQSNSETAVKMLKLSEQVSADQNMIREIQEALDAGYLVMRHIESALVSLDSAEGWGTWDLLGGGLVSDMIKHGHIDDATQEVELIQHSLLKLKTELADIRIDSNINIDIDGFAKFADFFFDGLIADWCMQSRIHDSQESVEDVKNQVQTVIHRLGGMERELTGHMEQLQQEIVNLVNYS